MRLLVVLPILFYVAAPDAKAQVLAEQRVETQLEVGVVAADIVISQKRDRIVLAVAAGGPFPPVEKEVDITAGGCREVFYAFPPDPQFSVQLTACTTPPMCRDEQQYLGLRADYLVVAAKGAPLHSQKVKDAIVRSVRPSLTRLPC
ncbi:hypothetical protein [Alsobacter sp. SYSU BS001988]|jgi:hypothetical protein